MPDSSLERIIVTVDDDHVANIQVVVDQLRAAGMQIENVLASSGIITGAVVSSHRDGLQAVAGVVGVEDDQEMRAW